MNEFYRKPYITQSYADMFERTSEKKLQDESVYKHSELKKPYESSSYDDMEQIAQPTFSNPRESWDWDMPGDETTTTPWKTTTKIPGRTTTTQTSGKKVTTMTAGKTTTIIKDGKTDTWTKKTSGTISTLGSYFRGGPSVTKPSDCFSLWQSLFGNWGGGFVDSDTASKMKKYAQTCPVYEYPSESCCKGGHFSGNTSTTFQSSGPPGCTYSWKKTKVSESGGVCTWLIEVFTIWETLPCSSTTITTPCDKSPTWNGSTFHYAPLTCGSASIGYVSQQMAVNGIQSLTVTDPTPGQTYVWEVASGGGSITSDGVYTAPATNANCTNNPTIALKVGTTVCDTLKIAVNGAMEDYAATNCHDIGSNHCIQFISCLGRTRCGPAVGWGVTCGDAICGVGSNFWFAYNTCGTSPGYGVVDTRSAGQKTAGCCPAQLL